MFLQYTYRALAVLCCACLLCSGTNAHAQEQTYFIEPKEFKEFLYNNVERYGRAGSGSIPFVTPHDMKKWDGIGKITIAAPKKVTVFIAESAAAPILLVSVPLYGTLDLSAEDIESSPLYILVKDKVSGTILQYASTEPYFKTSTKKPQYRAMSWDFVYDIGRHTFLPAHSASYLVSVKRGQVESNSVQVDVEVIAVKPSLAGMPQQYAKLTPAGFMDIEQEYREANKIPCVPTIDLRKPGKSIVRIALPASAKVRQPDTLLTDRLIAPIPICGVTNQPADLYDRKTTLYALNEETQELFQGDVFFETDAVMQGRKKVMLNVTLVNGERKLTEDPMDKIGAARPMPDIGNSAWQIVEYADSKAQQAARWEGGYFAYNLTRHVSLPRGPGRYLVWVKHGNTESNRERVEIIDGDE